VELDDAQPSSVAVDRGGRPSALQETEGPEYLKRPSVATGYRILAEGEAVELTT
jgi:hypothetical protein